MAESKIREHKIIAKKQKQCMPREKRRRDRARQRRARKKTTEAGERLEIRRGQREITTATHDVRTSAVNRTHGFRPAAGRVGVSGTTWDPHHRAPRNLTLRGILEFARGTRGLLRRKKGVGQAVEEDIVRQGKRGEEHIDCRVLLDRFKPDTPVVDYAPRGRSVKDMHANDESWRVLHRAVNLSTCTGWRKDGGRSAQSRVLGPCDRDVRKHNGETLLSFVGDQDLVIVNTFDRTCVVGVSNTLNGKGKKCIDCNLTRHPDRQLGRNVTASQSPRCSAGLITISCRHALESSTVSRGSAECETRRGHSITSG